MAQITTQFDTNVMYSEIERYETYYKGKRSQRQKYIMSRAIERFVKFNDLQNPSSFLLYVLSDKGLSAISSKSEQYMISALADELQKDIHIFQTLNK